MVDTAPEYPVECVLKLNMLDTAPEYPGNRTSAICVAVGPMENASTSLFTNSRALWKPIGPTLPDPSSSTRMSAACASIHSVRQYF